MLKREFIMNNCHGKNTFPPTVGEIACFVHEMVPQGHSSQLFVCLAVLHEGDRRRCCFGHVTAINSLQ